MEGVAFRVRAEFAHILRTRAALEAQAINDEMLAGEAQDPQRGCRELGVTCGLLTSSAGKRARDAAAGASIDPRVTAFAAPCPIGSEFTPR